MGADFPPGHDMMDEIELAPSWFEVELETGD